MFGENPLNPWVHFKPEYTGGSSHCPNILPVFHKSGPTGCRFFTPSSYNNPVNDCRRFEISPSGDKIISCQKTKHACGPQIMCG
jgi:hypothetical protein